MIYDNHGQGVKITLVGGTWLPQEKVQSSVVRKLGEQLSLLGPSVTVFNGGHLEDLQRVPLDQSDLILWMPNVPGENVPKYYPRKPTGAVMVCSKHMRPGCAKIDAVARIFKMHANAVIQIHPSPSGHFHFQLTDALGNDWVTTAHIHRLAEAILNHWKWTQGAIRVGSKQIARIADEPDKIELERLLAINRRVADQFEQNVGSRFFGNVSTRCQKMFPGMSQGFLAMVSPRNSDKRRLTVEDMVPVLGPLDLVQGVQYVGDRKPSVDAPVQLRLFEHGPRFFIHGHACIPGAPTTSRYVPCGDLRELDELVNIVRDQKPGGRINLRNHGFLLHSETLDDLEQLAQTDFEILSGEL